MKSKKPNHGSGKTRGNRLKKRGESWLKYADKPAKTEEPLESGNAEAGKEQ